MSCYSGSQDAVQCFMEGPEVLPVPHELLFRIPGCCSMLYECHEGSRGTPSAPWVAIQDPRVLVNASWVAMDGPEVLLVSRELLFRVPGCCSMLYGRSKGTPSAPWAAIQDPRVLFNALWVPWRVQRCSQCPMSCYLGSQGAFQGFMSGHGGSRGASSAPWVAIQDHRVLFYALTLTSNVMKHLLVTEDHIVYFPPQRVKITNWPINQLRKLFRKNFQRSKFLRIQLWSF